MPVTSGQLDTSEVVELLKQSAVEHLTEFRQLEAQSFAVEIDTTDFEALYAYKSGDYEHCLQLSSDSVSKPLSENARVTPSIFAMPEFIQLMDDDVASLAGLMMIVNPSCRERSANVAISQLTLSMYLTAQCAMKLQYSAKEVEMLLRLFDNQEYIKIGRQGFLFEQLLLKLTKQNILRYIATNACPEGAVRKRFWYLVLGIVGLFGLGVGAWRLSAARRSQ